jgi:hypothetical protein
MRRIGILGALIAFAGCADDGLERPDTPVRLTVWNSTDREIEEVRVHDGAVYLAAPNLLAEVLPDGGRAVVDIFNGQRVTVIRRNVAGGKRIAFTTARGLDVTGPGWVLQVFQESFRLYPPDLLDGPVNDGEGPSDDGGNDDGDSAPGDDAGGDP